MRAELSIIIYAADIVTTVANLDSDAVGRLGRERLEPARAGVVEGQFHGMDFSKAGRV